MLNLAKRPDGDRATIFASTAIKMGSERSCNRKGFLGMLDA